MRSRSLLPLLVLALALPAPASADDIDPIAHVAPASADPLVTSALDAADAFWARHGLQAGQRAEPLFYDELADPVRVAARGEAGGNRVFVTRRYRAWADRPRDEHDRRLRLVALCAVLTHERGHNLGLAHSSSWAIMAADVDAVKAAPTECFAWALAILPKRRARPVRARSLVLRPATVARAR